MFCFGPRVPEGMCDAGSRLKGESGFHRRLRPADLHQITRSFARRSFEVGVSPGLFAVKPR
jgi:hypothetical protein